MNMPMIQKEVTLKSDDQEIEVRPLPTEGRPNGFTGAVGEFKFDSFEIPNTWKTGEPQQITASLSGKGNFSLMNAPELVLADEPTGNLDRASALQVMELIAQINRDEGTTFLISTHDEKIAATCKRQIVVGDGVVTG
jgi:predicted ABC-type transport system involved in lysophospholipase L1 biosynthesis ATPase subunit